jgi:hypothetical protein
MLKTLDLRPRATGNTWPIAFDLIGADLEPAGRGSRPGALRQQGLADPVLDTAVVLAAAEMAR